MPTTIQLTEKTKYKLERFKHHPRETYEEVITELMELAEEDGLEFNKKAKESIARARADIKKGRVYSTKELIEELGI